MCARERHPPRANAPGVKKSSRVQLFTLRKRALRFLPRALRDLSPPASSCAGEPSPGRHQQRPTARRPPGRWP
eukprot:8678278-Pyramimonas_sp.AAC.1